MKLSPSALVDEARNGLEADVPCNGCTACCRDTAITVTDEEAERLGVEHTKIVMGRRVLAHQSDGACVFLEDDHCRIHAERPRTCRVFDCRRMALAGVTPGPMPHIAERVRQWQIVIENPSDRALVTQARALGRQVVGEGVTDAVSVGDRVMARLVDVDPTD